MGRAMGTKCKLRSGVWRMAPADLVSLGPVPGWASRGPVSSGVIFLYLAVGLPSMCLPSRLIAQTPSPLQEWQYVNAVPLMRVYQSAIPESEFILGAGGEDRP